MKKEIIEKNINHESIFTRSLQPGQTNFKIKLGRKEFYVDITKNIGNTYVDFYKKTTKNRNDQSKYDKSSVLCVAIKQNAILDRRFFENIRKIEAAQRVYSNFSSYI